MHYQFCIKPHLVVDRLALLSECPSYLSFDLMKKLPTSRSWRSENTSPVNVAGSFDHECDKRRMAAVGVLFFKLIDSGLTGLTGQLHPPGRRREHICTAIPRRLWIGRAPCRNVPARPAQRGTGPGLQTATTSTSGSSRRVCTLAVQGCTR